MTIDTLEHPVRAETARMRRQRHRHRRMMSILTEGLRDIPDLRPRRVPQAFVHALEKAALLAGDFAITTIAKDGIVVTLAGVPNRFWFDQVTMVILYRIKRQMEAEGRLCFFLPQRALEATGALGGPRATQLFTALIQEAIVNRLGMSNACRAFHDPLGCMATRLATGSRCVT